MRGGASAAAWLIAAVALAVAPGVAGAHPNEAGEVYVPWAEKVGKQRSMVNPGNLAPPLKGRYAIPRPQDAQICARTTRT